MELEPVSTFEGLFWDYLPTVVWSVAFVSSVVATVLFLMTWRITGKKGYAVLAITFSLPLISTIAGLLVITSRSIETHEGFVVSSSDVEIGIPGTLLIGALAAIMLYREEKEERKAAQPGATDNPDDA